MVTPEWWGEERKVGGGGTSSPACGGEASPACWASLGGASVGRVLPPEVPEWPLLQLGLSDPSRTSGAHFCTEASRRHVFGRRSPLLRKSAGNERICIEFERKCGDGSEVLPDAWHTLVAGEATSS